MPGLNSIDDLIRRLGGGAARRGTTTSPDALYDASGRSLPMDANGWPAGTEAWGSPARVTADVDPGVMRYLDEMAAKERAWYERFGFDPQSVNPAEGVGGVARRMDSGAPVEPDMGIEGELFGEMYKSAGAYDNLRKGRTTNLRNAGGDLARIAGDNIRRADDAARQSQMTGKLQDDLQKAAVGGALIGGAGGLAYMATPGTAPQMPGASADDVLSDPADNAALADETSPVPSVPATDDMPEPTAPARPDYKFQAREKIDQLNAMRRAAGGEVPQAAAMTKEIDRLLAMGDEQVNDPAYEESLPPDYHAQARLLLDKLNAMRMEAGGEVPDSAAILAEVRRLQALGDEIRNRPRSSAVPPRPMVAPPAGRASPHRLKLPSMPSQPMRPLGTSRSLPGRSSPSTT